MPISREDFLTDSDLTRREVEVEGLGTVLMRELTVGERLDWRKRLPAKLASDDVGEDELDHLLSLALVAVSLCVPGGGPMFEDGEVPEAVDLMKRKSQRTIETLQRAFLDLNGVTDEQVEQAVGNSTEITRASSSTGSPVISDTPKWTSSRAS